MQMTGASSGRTQAIDAVQNRYEGRGKQHGRDYG